MVSVIAIAGLPGSGKSVLCKALCSLPQFNGWEFKSTGGMLRDRHAMLLKEGKYSQDFIHYLNNLTDEEIILLNNDVKKLANQGNLILDSRFAVENCKKTNGALKIFLLAPLEVRIARQVKSNPSRSLEDARQDLEKREKWEYETGHRLYRYDYRDKDLYDLILDTSKLTVEEEVQAILAEMGL